MLTASHATSFVLSSNGSNGWKRKKTIADDIKDVYGEAKAMGFDTKILRKVISIRKQDHDERMEQEAILDTYLQALGMVPAAEDAA